MKIVSLFSGAGGFDLGFIKAGHDVVWANDSFSDCVETYRRNIGSNIILDDIENINIKDIPNCDMVIGGFPCQGFSIANMNRSKNDPRNKLYLNFLKVLKEKKPSLFLAENVKGILSIDKGKVFHRILTDFKKCGYHLDYAVLNAADYGVPQNRERVFIFGRMENLKVDIDFPPSRTHAKSEDTLKKWVPISDALKNIPEPDEIHDLRNHVYSKFKIKNNGYINHRKINPNKPAPTVTARGDMKGGAMINQHPNNKRRMSVRETAIIQSFPIDFEFFGSMTSSYTQVGNAVPPLLASSIAKGFPISLTEKMNKKKKNYLPQQLKLPIVDII